MNRFAIVEGVSEKTENAIASVVDNNARGKQCQVLYYVEPSVARMLKEEEIAYQRYGQQHQ
jgi:hypothetical protein